VEQDGTQGDGDGHMMVIKCPTLEKKKEKNKILWAQGKGINRDFVLPVKMQ
jgi:hypothetical protein